MEPTRTIARQPSDGSKIDSSVTATAAGPQDKLILERVRPWFASDAQALAWFDQTALPGFGGKTAQQLVAANHVDWVVAYLDGVEAGIHA